MIDINSKALRLARVNASAAGVSAQFLEAGDLEAVEVPVDLALANPPYIIDAEGRQYRDGGGAHGGQVAFDMASEAMTRLAPGGRLILYTGSAIIDGTDRLRLRLGELAKRANCSMRCTELDPDVFGEELERTCYAEVERLALIGAVFTRSSVGAGLD